MGADLCVVVIGRNEGEHLKACLGSVRGQCDRIVYVDSGSSDGSLAHAAASGVAVVPLDMGTPFSAGRARNEGFGHALRLWPDARFVQFVDGDCELEGEWLRLARKHLDAHGAWAIVAGRVRERYPHKSVYNFLCDMEWATPVGEAEACGGIFMVRVTAFQAVAGFNPVVIAGEEPELGYRLRKAGWQIHRLDLPMALHDADINRFSQWWRRAVRSGYAYAQGYALHGNDRGRYCLRDSLRIWFWALLIPGLVLLVVAMHGWWWWLLLVLYPAQLVKIAISLNRRPCPWRHSFTYAFFILLGKWPQLLGQLLYWGRTIAGRDHALIE